MLHRHPVSDLPASTPASALPASSLSAARTLSDDDRLVAMLSGIIASMGHAIDSLASFKDAHAVELSRRCRVWKARAEKALNDPARSLMARRYLGSFGENGNAYAIQHWADAARRHVARGGR